MGALSVVPLGTQESQTHLLSFSSPVTDLGNANAIPLSLIQYIYDFDHNRYTKSCEQI